MIEFVRDFMAPAHGFEHSDKGASEYMQAKQPAAARGIAVPTLEMLTINDSLITKEMIGRLQSLYKESPHVITCMTVEGTHMVRYEGWKPSCWLCRTSSEFLNAVLKS